MPDRYFKIRSSENSKLFKRQRNFCSRLYKRERKKYFNNLDSNKITDNRLVWKTVKPLLKDKGSNTTNIYLVDEGKTVTEDKEVAKTLNQYFSTAVDSFDNIENKSLLIETKNLEDPVEIVIKKFENHLSVFLIKGTVNINELFQFSEIASEQVLSEINDLENKKFDSKIQKYKNQNTKIF